MAIGALRRFTATPLEHVFEVQGATVRMATNSQGLLDRLLSILGSSSRRLGDTPVFVWRVVVEPNEEVEAEVGPSESQRLSHNGLAFVNFGQKNFLAVDILARQGESFVSERLISDERLFRRHFLPAFFYLINESIAIRV